MNNLTDDKRMLVYGPKSSHTDIFCFSTTRHGGCSEGNYASFNCNHYCGDVPDKVERNRELLCSLLPVRPRMLVVPHQTHDTVVKVVDEAFLRISSEEQLKQLEGVDAMVSDLKQVCLCISTADCIPVLCYDTRRKVIAAIHAGWRGTVKRIVEKTLDKMAALYGTKGEDVQAYIGPGISLMLLKWEMRCMKPLKQPDLIWLASPAEMKSGTSTFGKPTGYSCCLKE